MLAVRLGRDDAPRVISGGRSAMAAAAHLSQLERRHRMLEEQIADAKVHSSVDDMKVAKLNARSCSSRMRSSAFVSK